MKDASRTGVGDVPTADVPSLMALCDEFEKRRFEPVASMGVDSDETSVKYVVFRDKRNDCLYKARLDLFGRWMIGRMIEESLIASSEPEPFHAAVLREKTGKFTVW